MKKIILPLSLICVLAVTLLIVRSNRKELIPSAAPAATRTTHTKQSASSGSEVITTQDEAPTEQPLNSETVRETPEYKEAVAEATADGGPLPQGEPIVEVAAVDVIDDPKDFGGIIIPQSDEGIFVPGEQAILDISAYGKKGTLTPNQVGRFPVMVVVPDGEVDLTLSYPELEAGTEVSLYCADGGLINGEPKLSVTLDENHAIQVSWTGNHNTGYHSVASFVGNDEKLVRFWVGPRALAY